ncbi:Hypothetical predicted protein [Marmota monax]|uniref:Uncharacterized protein n=1 Tax=Marmota monax TaxID=9995 RepID=A0A5E4B1M5_MARMO|nr:Hypothetical predicted protein [Marmota monax]
MGPPSSPGAGPGSMEASISSLGVFTLIILPPALGTGLVCTGAQAQVPDAYELLHGRHGSEPLGPLGPSIVPEVRFGVTDWCRPLHDHPVRERYRPRTGLSSSDHTGAGGVPSDMSYSLSHGNPKTRLPTGTTGLTVNPGPLLYPNFGQAMNNQGEGQVGQRLFVFVERWRGRHSSLDRAILYGRQDPVFRADRDIRSVISQLVVLRTDKSVPRGPLVKTTLRREGRCLTSKCHTEPFPVEDTEPTFRYHTDPSTGVETSTVMSESNRYLQR